METISDKLTYLATTKSKIKTMLQYANSNVTDLTTFRAYSNESFQAYLNIMLNPDNLFNTLPKITTTPATSFSVNNTIEAPIKIDCKGNSYQEGTPTPDSPQEVEVVTGRQEIDITGFNIWDEQWELGTLDNSTGAKSSANNCIRSKNYISIIPNTTYYIKTAYSSACYYDKNYNYISYAQLANQTFTTPNNAYYMLFRNATSYGTTYNNDICINISDTTKNGTYESYIGQSYEINLGKNFFNSSQTAIYRTTAIETLINNGVKVTDTATGTNHSVLYKISDVSLLVGNTYTLKANWSASGTNLGRIGIGLCDENGENRILGQYSDTSGNSISYTIPTITTSKYLAIWLYSNTSGTATANTTYVDYTNIQLEKGFATEYAPYFTPIELCKIGDYQDRIFKTSGKNLFDGELELGIINGNTGSNAENSSYIRNKNYIPVEELTDYTITSPDLAGSIYVYEYKADFTYNLSSNKVITQSETLTTNAGTKYIRFRPNTSTTDTTIRFMINEESTSIPYEPYGSNEWYIEKKIGKVVLNGSESWSIWNIDNPNTQRFYTTFNDGMINPNTFGGISYTNNFTYASGNDDNEHYRSSSTGNKPDLVIFINRNRLNSVDVSGFKAWVSTHNLEVYYVLGNYTYTKITELELIEQLNDLEKANSYNNQTNITQNGNLPFILDIKLLQDIRD